MFSREPEDELLTRAWERRSFSDTAGAKRGLLDSGTLKALYVDTMQP